MIKVNDQVTLTKQPGDKYPRFWSTFDKMKGKVVKVHKYDDMLIEVELNTKYSKPCIWIRRDWVTAC